jgi:hypothetical protein
MIGEPQTGSRKGNQEKSRAAGIRDLPAAGFETSMPETFGGQGEIGGGARRRSANSSSPCWLR